MISLLLAYRPYFYPRPHMEGDLDICSNISAPLSFYPRPHMEGDQIANKHFAHHNISTHALTWRATSAGPSCCAALSISTHALTWRATVTTVLVPWIKSNFYPRPHMEGDEDLRELPVLDKSISTHALTWRATSAGLIHSAVLLFLPTPSHGGRRRQVTFCLLQGENFYPRPHMEGDRFRDAVSLVVLISTHALTWRATSIT